MTTRLVAKAHDGSLQLQVLYTKAMVGGKHSSVMSQAQELVELRLLPTQITHLTGIPNGNVMQLYEVCGKLSRVGRPKTSYDSLINTVEIHILASVFATLVERHMAMKGETVLVSHHVLSAVRTLRGHAPLQTADVDWERLVQVAMSVDKGLLVLQTCGTCATRHVVKPDSQQDRLCPICRLVESVTDVVKTPDCVSVLGQPVLRAGACVNVPRKIRGQGEVRMRFRVASGGAD